MTVLITGGAKCGKSRYSEEIFTGFTGKKYYIATMQPDGEEAQAAIARHRAQREGKGFVTIEQYFDLTEVCVPEGSGVLLECLGNLCANVLFGSYPRDAEKCICNGIRYLSERAECLVIVTNQVGADGIDYAEGTMRYMKLLGEMNRYAASLADVVAECVFGIPVFRKGRPLW